MPTVKFDNEIEASTKEISGANLLRVDVGSNHPQGGDAGHGGRTYFRLTDRSATAWSVRVVTRDGVTEIHQPESVELILAGDSEHDTFVEALEFAAEILRHR